ncbi:MAG: hypothetical protein AAFP83_15750 [Bacteroidota bacterium]
MRKSLSRFKIYAQALFPLLGTGLLLSFLISSCSWEDDAQFIPETQEIYILVEENDPSSQILYQIVDTQVIPFLPGTDVTDIDGADTELWMCVQGQVRVYDAESQEERSWRGQDFEATTLVVGETTVLLCDSINDQLVFLDRQKLTEESRKSPVVSPQLPFYKAGKFYLVENDSTLRVYQETAYALIRTLPFPLPISDIYTNDRADLFLGHLSDSTYRETMLDVNGLQILAQTEETDYTKRRFSPYPRANFGKELLGNLRLFLDQRVSNTVQAQDFEADFLEAEIYYLAQDTLSRYDWFEKTIHTYPISGSKILGFHTYIDYPQL